MKKILGLPHIFNISFQSQSDTLKSLAPIANYSRLVQVCLSFSTLFSAWVCSVWANFNSKLTLNSYCWKLLFCNSVSRWQSWCRGFYFFIFVLLYLSILDCVQNCRRNRSHRSISQCILSLSFRSSPHFISLYIFLTSCYFNLFVYKYFHIVFLKHVRKSTTYEVNVSGAACEKVIWH